MTKPDYKIDVNEEICNEAALVQRDAVSMLFPDDTFLCQW
jgi:hypothetical protein